MSMTGCEGMGAYDLLEKQDWKASAKRHSCQDQPVNNLSGTSSDVKNMVYLTHLLPTYLLHFTYGISLGVVISFLALYPLLFTSPHWRVPKHLGASAQRAEEQLDHTWAGLRGPRCLSWLRLNCSHIICCRTNAGISSYVLQVYHVYIYTIPDHVCTIVHFYKPTKQMCLHIPCLPVLPWRKGYNWVPFGHPSTPSLSLIISNGYYPYPLSWTSPSLCSCLQKNR